MSDEISKLPVENEDMKAGLLAALSRIESIQASRNLIDSMSEEEWHSVAPDDWCIEAGSNDGDDEIDGLDAEVINAA
jgi:hypothetical protein